MAAPISQFGYIQNGLEVQFTSLSLNVDLDTTYSWDFGDGQVSTDENPTHTYVTEEFFEVALTVTKGIEVSTSTVTINLTGTPPPTLFQNISSLIDLYSPTSLVGSITHNQQKEFLIAKWQLYLQPLVIDPSVAVGNTHIESSWPPLVNSLIAKLVVIDIIEMESSKMLMAMTASGTETAMSSGTINQGGTSGGTNNSSSNPTPGPIKSIETGPTKIERYENRDNSSTTEATNNLSKAWTEMMTKGGFIETTKVMVCQEAERLRIYLPACGHIKSPTLPFKVVKPGC